MRLIEDAEFLAGAITANFVVPDRVFFAAEVDQAVEEFKRNRDRDRAAAVEFSRDMNLEEFFKRLDAWRKAHREVHRPTDPDCSCRTIDVEWFTIIDAHIDALFYWAGLTDEERDRQFEWLRDAAIKHLSKGKRRRGVVPVLRGLPAPDPHELLITTLASAPGAPPAVPCLLSEGHLAA